MSSDIDTLASVPSGKPVRIFLPIINGPDRVRAQCIFQESTPPQFQLIFKPGVLPVDDIDRKGTCIVSIDMGGPTLSLEAVIKGIENPQTLLMRLKKSISHEQMREFFRVDAVTQVISKSFHSEFSSGNSTPWTKLGQTVDISGSGILAHFSDEPPADNQVRLEITVPYPEPEMVKVLARKIRVTKLKEGGYEVAYHFDDIATEDRDKIIGCCLIIQRKLLRLKVQVKDSF